MGAALITMAALAGAAYIPFHNRKISPGWTAAIKPLCALILAFLFGFYGFWWVSFAFVLAALGDAFLVRDEDWAFAAGLVSFLAAHLVFIFMLERVFVVVEGDLMDPLNALMLLSGIGLIFFALIWGGVPHILKIPVLIYIAVLVLKATLATITTPLLLAGALVFMASDSALAVQRFRYDLPGIGLFVWLTYVAALLLLGLGFWQFLEPTLP